MKRKKNVLNCLAILILMFLMFANSCKKDDAPGLVDTPVLVATLTTSTVIDITTTTATGGGTITLDGGDDVTERGICWGTSANPTVADFKAIAGKGLGSFTGSITGLTEKSTYYIRAYAINSAGIAYGNEQNFTTQAIGAPLVSTASLSEITSVSALCGGDVTSDGEGAIKERGICYSDVQNPTISSTKVIATGTTGSFISQLTGLNLNTTYYVKAFATNSAGTSYGNEVSFKTFDIPTVTTSEATNITPTTSTCGGEVTSDGGLAITERGICYSTNVNPTISSTRIITTGTIGVFTSSITGLAASTTYYMRAFATNSAGTSYGNEVTFISLTNLPTITTSEATDITQTTATCGGEVSNDGGLTISERGVCYSTTQNPTTTNSKVIATGTTGAFTANLSGLTNNVTYYIRAYATNSAGTTYGNEISFIAGTIKDIDGNLYHTVTIGTQVWLVENLKTTRYNDGSDIPAVVDNAAWAALTTPGYCWYNNDAATNKAIYGALYNWYAFDPSSNGNKNISPVGWHVASIQDWTALRVYLNDNGYNYDGTTDGNNIAKALCAVTNWTASSTVGAVGNTDYPAMRNITGFTGLPAGYRATNGTFNDINNSAIWWTSYDVDALQGWGPYIGSGATSLFSWYREKDLGLSVRCVKD